MTTIFEVSTTNYEEQKKLIIKAMEHLQTLCKVEDGFELGKPTSRFGWTFFKMAINPNILHCIDNNLTDMLQKSKGKKSEEKLTNLLSDFLESRSCKVKLKISEN